jgi:hypothetical protein
MVRSAKRVSNHVATDRPAFFETLALQAPQSLTEKGRVISIRL